MGKDLFGTACLLAALLVPRTSGAELSAQVIDPASRGDLGTIQGTVLDRRTGQTLPNAQVFIDRLEVGVLANAAGAYRIENVPAGPVTVEVRLLGYEDGQETLQVTPGATVTASFDLEQQALPLDEILVTGTLGGLERRRVGHVVERVDMASRVAVSPSTNLNQLLSQRTPSMQAPGQQGVIGTGSIVRVRGASSLQLGSNPLLYVDGIRVDNNLAAGPALRGGPMVVRMHDFDPSDIETVEVLKGPAATTLHGLEAANGVIHITTKKGVLGAPVVDLSIRQGANWLPNPESRFFTTYSYDPDAQRLDSLNIYRDHQARTGRPVFTHGGLQYYDASVRGGTEEVRYYTSVGWDDEVGIVDYNWNKRFSARANLSLRPSDTWDASVGLGYTQSRTRFAQAGGGSGIDIWTAILFAAPDELATFTRGFRYAPPEVIATQDTRSRTRRFTGGFQLRHRPTPWLTHQAVAGLDASTEKSTQVFPRIAEGEYSFLGGLSFGERRLDETDTQYLSLDYTATASVDLPGGVSSATSVGAQYHENRAERFTALGAFFRQPGNGSITSSQFRDASESWVGNETRGWYVQELLGFRNERLFLAAALRSDWSSAFGANVDWVFFPKASATWVISEEPFWPLSWVDQLRLRSAWGRAGTQPPAVRLGGSSASVTPQRATNPDLRNEIGEELELGFDLALLRDRLSIAYTYYRKNTKDALLQVPVPAEVGAQGNWNENLGHTRSWGHELLVAGAAVDRPRVGLDLSVALATQRNRILDLGRYQTAEQFGTRHRVGYPVGGRFVTHILSGEFIPGTTTPTNLLCDGGTGEYGYDFGGLPVPCTGSTTVFLGTSVPTWLGNVTTALRLGSNLRINTVTEFQGGNFSDGGVSGATRSMNNTIAVNPLDDPRMAAYLTLLDSAYSGDYECGFARLREVSFWYSLPQGWSARAGVSRASIMVGARNLAFLWRAQKYTWDEAGFGGTPAKGGSLIFDPEQQLQGDRFQVGQVIGIPPLANLIVAFNVTL